MEESLGYIMNHMHTTYKKSEEIMQDCIFIFDTNVLLPLYTVGSKNLSSIKGIVNHWNIINSIFRNKSLKSLLKMTKEAQRYV